MRDSWQDFVEFLIQEFSDSVDHATCLLMILKYMASDCDNDSIVIEESMRREFFTFLDEIAPQVFETIFNAWSANLIQGGLGQIVRPLNGRVAAQPAQNEREQLKMQKMRSKLVEAFYNWIKLKLPDTVF